MDMRAMIVVTGQPQSSATFGDLGHSSLPNGVTLGDDKRNMPHAWRLAMG
jgi:hypothetical protein